MSRAFGDMNVLTRCRVHCAACMDARATVSSSCLHLAGYGNGCIMLQREKIGAVVIEWRPTTTEKRKTLSTSRPDCTHGSAFMSTFSERSNLPRGHAMDLSGLSQSTVATRRNMTCFYPTVVRGQGGSTSNAVSLYKHCIPSC